MRVEERPFPGARRFRADLFNADASRVRKTVRGYKGEQVIQQPEATTASPRTACLLLPKGTASVLNYNFRVCGLEINVG